MAIEVILLEDVPGLGKIAETVRVADGYARNYLLPRKLAQTSNPGLLRQLEAKKFRLQKEHAERIEVAKSMADKIAEISIEIPVAVADNDQLYGSVNAQMILDALLEKGIELDRTALQLKDGIKTLGETSVTINLHTEVKCELKVNVVKKS